MNRERKVTNIQIHQISEKVKCASTGTEVRKRSLIQLYEAVSTHAIDAL